MKTVVEHIHDLINIVCFGRIGFIQHFVPREEICAVLKGKESVSPFQCRKGPERIFHPSFDTVNSS
jgi:hypothetical protein